MCSALQTRELTFADPVAVGEARAAVAVVADRLEPVHDLPVEAGLDRDRGAAVVDLVGPEDEPAEVDPVADAPCSIRFQVSRKRGSSRPT
jgi:hypothetical protein